ncbi:MAG: ROK family protein [Phycisphaerales bacterium]
MASIGIDIGGTSVKAALLGPGAPPACAAPGAAYTRPSRDELLLAVRNAARSLDTRGVVAVGICAPGIVDHASGRFTASVNVPGLVGLSLSELIEPLELPNASARLVTDAHAAAADFAHRVSPLPARVLALSLGTGVGACMLDQGVPLIFSGRSPGHFGQLDVSLDDHPPIGPDGGAGGLEAYIGLPALTARYGCRPEQLPPILAALTPDDPPLRALARAIRIGHAMFRPDAVWLLGGVGVALRPALPLLRGLVAHNLTSLARPGWALESGADGFHAARGAARLAEDDR